MIMFCLSHEWYSGDTKMRGTISYDSGTFAWMVWEEEISQEKFMIALSVIRHSDSKG